MLDQWDSSVYWGLPTTAWITLGASWEIDTLEQMNFLALNIKNAVPGTPRFDKVVDVLFQVNSDVIVLTECGPEAFDDICRELGATGAVYAPADYWGNGIISLHHVVMSDGVVDLTIRSEHRSAADSEHRSAAVALLELKGGGTLQVVATHLEVSDESARLEQIELLDQQIGLSESFLVGDLNALNRRDYDKARLERLLEVRHQGGKRPPRWDVLDCLIDVYGCLDASVNQPFEATTPYSSRVDYFLLGPQLGVQIVENSYRVIDCLTNDISDHNAIFCTINTPQRGSN
jgi:endonuclease/exonuclease/phosphatase family metal-dependent hydrolase